MRLVMTHPAVASALATAIVQPLYDTIQIGISNSGQVDFFQVPIGGTGVSGTGTKQLNDTNLSMNGQLSQPDQFVVRSFKLQPLNRATAVAGFAATSWSLQDLADIDRTLNQTVFRFSVGSNTGKVVEALAALFPAGFGLDGMVTTGGTTTAGQNLAYIVGSGSRDLTNTFSLGKEYGELLRAGENFRGSFFWPQTVANSATFQIRAFLGGHWSQGVR